MVRAVHWWKRDEAPSAHYGYDLLLIIGSIHTWSTVKKKKTVYSELKTA